MKIFDILKNLVNAKSPFSRIQRMYRFFFWQVIAKRRKRPFHFLLPDGARMSLRPAEHGASTYYYFGYPDYEEMLFMKDNLKKGELFVDAGANSGGWSMTALGMGARVIAFEPIADTFARLVENIGLNNSEMVTAHNVGLSDKEDVLTFSSDLDAGNKIISAMEPGKHQSVKVFPLDHFLDGMDPSIIKIDVEGHELNVIKGAPETLKKKSLRALIIETFRWFNYSRPEIIEMEAILSSYGFFPVRYVPENRAVVKLTGGEGGQNTIYVKGF